uniref:Uncharacterized protein n=1 Tax=Trypanosoma congolense (strain IL3000) TaxID=1068625 RepID=G0UPT1_TRYCI|nr:conserved hypothetical protein [Trypanosoma congolense IL3000]
MHFPDRTGGSCNTTYIPCTVDKADSNPARQRPHEECGDVPVESYVSDNAFTYQASLRESSANQLPHGVSDAANSLASFINPTGWGNIATGVGNEGTFVVPIGKLNGGGLVSDVNAASIYPKGGVSDLAVELSYTLLDAPLPNLEKNEMDFQDDCLANVFPRSGSPFKGLSPDSEDPFSMIHLQPLTYSDNIWEVKEKEASVSPQRNDGGKRTSQITPTLFSPLVDTLDSINGDGKKSCDRPLRNKKSASQDPEEEQRIPVVDPQRSKLHVPLSSIIPTKALGGRVSFPSLCLLYQSGRCFRGLAVIKCTLSPE